MIRTTITLKRVGPSVQKRSRIGSSHRARRLTSAPIVPSALQCRSWDAVLPFGELSTGKHRPVVLSPRQCRGLQPVGRPHPGLAIETRGAGMNRDPDAVEGAGEAGVPAYPVGRI